MKIRILLTVYEDWQSFYEVVEKIENLLINTEWKNYELIIINDSSSEPLDPKKIKNSKYHLINLIQNVGNQKAIYLGLQYAYNKNDFDFLVILDSDGEDKPEDIIKLLDLCKNKKSEKIIFAKRIKRKEGVFFLFFYNLYKFIFNFLTNYELDFGNFSCIPIKFLKKITLNPEVQFHYSGSIIKSNIPIEKISCEKGSRLYGNSTMGLNRKLHHGLMSLSLFSDKIAIKFFFISISLMFFTTIIAVAVIILRIFSKILLTGWASNFLLGLFIIFIILLLISFFSLLIILFTKNNDLNYENILNEKKIIESIVYSDKL